MPSVSHLVGLARLIRFTFFLFASMGHPAEYASVFLGNAALNPSRAFFPCPSVTVGITLLKEGAGDRVVAQLPGWVG